MLQFSCLAGVSSASNRYISRVSISVILSSICLVDDSLSTTNKRKQSNRPLYFQSQDDRRKAVSYEAGISVFSEAGSGVSKGSSTQIQQADKNTSFL